MADSASHINMIDHSVIVRLRAVLLAQLSEPGCPGTAQLTWRGIAWRRLVVYALYGLVAYSAWGNLAALARIAWARVNDPWPLQWLEPLFFRSALQAYHGLPLYPAPSLDYAGAMYTPAGDLLHALVMHLSWVGYQPLRVVAMLAFLGLLALLVVWIRRDSGRLLWALLVAAGLLTAARGLGYWPLQINVDHYWILCALWAVYLVSGEHDGQGRHVASGLLAALAFLFKQHAFFVAAAIGLYLLLHRRKRLLWWAVPCAGLAGLVSLSFLLASGGAFWECTVGIPGAIGDKPVVYF